MRLKAISMSLPAAAVLGSSTLMPTAANAQDWLKRAFTMPRHQHYTNDWRDIAAGAGALGALGLLEHDDTLFFAGTAGALYSAYRYDRDRHILDRYGRARAE